MVMAQEQIKFLPAIKPYLAHSMEDTNVDAIWDNIIHSYFCVSQYSLDKRRWGERRDSIFVLSRDQDRVPIVMYKCWSGGRYASEVWEDTQSVFRPQADAGRKAKKRIHVIIAVQRKCKFYEYDFAEMEWTQREADGVRPYRALDIVDDAADVQMLLNGIVSDIPRLVSNRCKQDSALSPSIHVTHTCRIAPNRNTLIDILRPPYAHILETSYI